MNASGETVRARPSGFLESRTAMRGRAAVATSTQSPPVSPLYEDARLVAHEIDHLDGLLYLDRIRTGVEPVPVEEYRQTGRAWAYER
ncbi:Peptide deformylase [Actinobacteria bacterium OK074]|nr:Peptide deformylase [Actinobacteria bacterium OK074]